MTTTFTCTTPEEGWTLCLHFLAGRFAIINGLGTLPSDVDEADKQRHDRTINDAWTNLVGNLYIIVQRMRANGHYAAATKMQEFVDLLVAKSPDRADQHVRDQLRDAYFSLEKPVRNLEGEDDAFAAAERAQDAAEAVFRGG